jgi:hypothetical protein
MRGYCAKPALDRRARECNTLERISESNPVCQLTSLDRELHRTGPTGRSNSHAHADLRRSR